MAVLWGGRFTKETDDKVFNFNESLSFDKRLYAVDINGSKCHAKMLGKQGIITEAEAESIIKGLDTILNDIESGKLEFDNKCEDIHSFIEANLTERIGDAGKKLHTGRSRNDQVALDMRIYTKNEVLTLSELLTSLLTVLLNKMKENTETYMPAFTHLQKAQPTNLSHYIGAYVEMFLRDRDRLADIIKRIERERKY